MLADVVPQHAERHDRRPPRQEPAAEDEATTTPPAPVEDDDTEGEAAAEEDDEPEGASVAWYRAATCASDSAWESKTWLSSSLADATRL